VLGNHLTVLTNQSETNVFYNLIEGRTPKGYQTPPHRHTRYSEQFFVLDGEFTIWAEEQTTVLRGGDSFLIPTGVVHVVAATGEQDVSRGLVIASPGGFASVIEATGVPVTGGAALEPTATEIEEFTRRSAEIGDEILGPPGSLPADILLAP
jgi:quercetin dioxygenase-like cupin family protein